MDISVIKVPIGYAGCSIGTELGPDCICSKEFLSKLSTSGNKVKIVSCPVSEYTTGEIEHPQAKYLSSVVKTNTALATIVDKELWAGNFPIVVGGDHSVFLGSIAGVASYVNNVSSMNLSG